MSADFSVDSVDWSKYAWKPSFGDSPCYQREAAGGELFSDFIQRTVAGQQIIFFGGNTTLRSPLSPTEFVDRLRDAWITLRYTTPIIALRTEHDSTGNTLMTYRVESDTTKVKEWAARTVCIAKDVQDLDELRYNLSRKSLPDAFGDQTFVFVCHITDSQYGLLIHTSHVPFDGFGIRIVFNRLLSNLATFIGGASLADIKWGSEVINLPPALPSVTTEPLEGPEYIRTVSSVVENLRTAMPVSRMPFKSKVCGNISDSLRGGVVSKHATLTPVPVLTPDCRLFSLNQSLCNFSRLVAVHS